MGHRYDPDATIQFGSVSYTTLHPETDPQSIADAQRSDVEAAWSLGLREPEEISFYCALPLWNVRRCLGELGYGPPVRFIKAKPKTPGRSSGMNGGQAPLPKEVVEKVRAALVSRPLSITQLVSRIAASHYTLRRVLRESGQFKAVATKVTARKPMILWGIAS